MIQAKVDGGKPTIVYIPPSDDSVFATKDYLPIGVYVDGELAPEISAVETYATSDENPKTLITEYNNSLIHMGFTGATVQNGIPEPSTPAPIQNVNTTGKNIFTRNNETEGYNLNYRTGELSTQSSMNTSDFIEVSPNTIYKLSITETNYTGWTERKVIAYNENKAFLGVLGGLTAKGNITYTTVFKTLYTGIKYIRVSYKPTDTDVSIKSIMQIELHGNNLFDINGEKRYVSYNVSVSNNSLIATNILFAHQTYIMYSKLYPAGTYTISYNTPSAVSSFRILASSEIPNISVWVDNSQSYSAVFEMSEPSTRVSGTFTMRKPFQIGFVFLGPEGGTYEINDIMLSKESDVYDEYFGKVVEIPTDLTLPTSDPPSFYLYLSKYDSIAVNYKEKTVEYRMGSYVLYANDSALEISQSDIDGKIFYILDWKANPNLTDIDVVSGRGDCSHFKLDTEYPPDENNVFIVERDKVLVAWSGTEPVIQFLEFAQQQADNGTPITFLLLRENPKIIDISSTGLGRSLLDLYISRNTITFLEISGNGEIPIIPLDLSYYTWGGRNENNSNT